MNNNNTPDDIDWINADEFTDLVIEYRDEMLRSLGVVGTEHSMTYSAPGEQIRRYPVEATDSHVTKGISTHRILTDVSVYDDEDGKSEITPATDTRFMTIRETTGYAAIQSSATFGLGWKTVPTPREVRLAEHLENYNESDIQTGRVPRSKAAEKIIEELFPSNSKYDESELWLDVRETSVDNVRAIEDCVSALRYREDSYNNHIVRYHEDYSDEEPDGPLDYRLSSRGLIIEKYFDNPSGEFGSESWHRVYAGYELDEVDAEVDAMGYVFAEGEDDEEDLETSVVTIPEMKLPQDVLDLPAPMPNTPHSDDD